MRGEPRNCSGESSKPHYVHPRNLILPRIGKEKRCLKFLKKRIGSHDLAKKKREEMQAVLQAMRKKPAA